MTTAIAITAAVALSFAWTQMLLRAAGENKVAQIIVMVGCTITLIGLPHLLLGLAIMWARAWGRMVAEIQTGEAVA